MHFFDKGHISIVLLLFLAYIPAELCQNKGSIEYVENELEKHVEYLGPEKVYVHTDKDFYTVGETIWFKGYLVDGITHTQSERSKVLHVELLNDKDSIITERKLYVQKIGVSGDIEITNEMLEGVYRLRAYTNFMFNE
ncbi:MAG: hypothetical protein AAF361_05835, partial [Bacteroidota bacterium]